MTDVIIIGAGAAGLMAANESGKAGKSVIIIEARNRIGGRIHTIQSEGFSGPVEAGAEFIHGDLPVTLSLLREANISFYEGTGAAWQVKDGRLNKGEFFTEGWGEMMDTLNNLEHDMSLRTFLDQYFSDPKYNELRDSVIRFVQGYDAADINRVSVFALREEWNNEDSTIGYHPEGGYSKLMDFLAERCQQQGASIHLSKVVTTVKWNSGQIEVMTADGDHYTARKVLITIPVSVLKTGAISFDPPIPEQMNAFNKLGNGNVIKFLIEFKRAFWESNHPLQANKMPDMHFLFSDAFIPTWWTQRPAPIPLLTGWLAGPPEKIVNQTDDELLEEAFRSLAYLFDCSDDVLKGQARTARVFNWARDPFTQGAYAYKTIEADEALKLLTQPVKDTIYFAGEALYDGPAMGTVEAALASGAEAAKLIAQ